MVKISVLVCVLPLVSGVLITTKRTQSSRDGKADEDFFDTYFGAHDNTSTYGPCLFRNLGLMLPARVGMHFPTSNATIDKSGGTSLGDWQLRNKAALGNMSAYNGLMDWATVFYVPDLDAHMKQFKTDSVAVMQRSYTSSNNVEIYVAIVHTPGSGHVLELQSPKCSTCTESLFASDECAVGHRLPKDMAFYAEAWQNATSDASQWSTVGPAALPAPMVVQFKQTSTDLDLVEKLYKELMPTSRRSYGDCTTLSAGPVGVGPFGGPASPTLPEYPLEFLFVLNKAQLATVKPFTDFIDQLHDERVGFGWGWDRSMDFHTKLTDSTTMGQETKPGVSLDHWASLLTEHQIKFATFNLSQSCDGSGADAIFPPGPFGQSSMIYSAGPANMGIEFWGTFNYSFYSAEKPAYNWGGAGGCSPTFDCRAYLSPPDCRGSSTQQYKTIRERVAANPPSNSAYARLDCGSGSVIDGIRLATFGTASGTCETGFVESPKCTKDITSLAQIICIGQTSCNVPASTAFFGVPCNSSTGWWTTVEATCATGSRDPSPEELSFVV